MRPLHSSNREPPRPDLDLVVLPAVEAGALEPAAGDAEVRDQIAIAAHAAADGAEAAAIRSGGRGAGELALAPLVGRGPWAG